MIGNMTNIDGRRISIDRTSVFTIILSKFIKLITTMITIYVIILMLKDLHLQGCYFYVKNEFQIE